MKKILCIAAVLAIASSSAFADGNIALGGSLHGIWNWNTLESDNLEVTLLFAPANTATSLAGFTGGANGSATNAIINNTGGAVDYSTDMAWSDVINDMNNNGWFQLDGATNSNPLYASVNANGSFLYNNSSSWSAANVNANTTYSVIELAWDTGNGLWTTLDLAEENDTYIGWSKVIQYTPTSNPTAPTIINGTLVGFYGVGGALGVPEPSTVALAGLGGLSLMLIRRRK